jgi:CheY-like chemotaxis protein
MAQSGRLRDSHRVTSETPGLQRIVVVDDSDGFRSLLQWFLGSLPEVQIVAEARDGLDAIEQVGRTKPDLVLMDVCMPKLDGLQTTRKLRTEGESARIVLLTAYGDTIPRWLAEEVGADDVLDKSNLGERLREAVIGGARRLPKTEKLTKKLTEKPKEERKQGGNEAKRAGEK